MAATRRLELVEGTSNKFWEIGVDGASHTVRFGRIGTRGQTKTKTFATEREAQRDADKLVDEKLGKGYREAAPAAAPPVAPPATPPAKAAAAMTMTLQPPRGKAAIVIAIAGSEVDIDGTRRQFETPALAKQHVDKLVQVRLTQGYTLGEVNLPRPVAPTPEPEPTHVADDVEDVADLEPDGHGGLLVTFEPLSAPTSKACAAIATRIAAAAPRALHVIGDPEIPGPAWAKGLARKVLPSVRDFIFDVDFLSPGQQSTFSLGDLRATFAAMPGLERCFLTGALEIGERGTHATLRQLHALGDPLAGEFLRALATWALPTLEVLALSLTNAAFPMGGDDDAALAMMDGRWAGVRTVHLDGLSDVGGALEALLGSKALRASALRVEGSVGDEDDLIMTVERHARRIGELEVLGLPFARVSTATATRLRAFGSTIRDLADLPSLTTPSTYTAWTDADRATG